MWSMIIIPFRISWDHTRFRWVRVAQSNFRCFGLCTVCLSFSFYHRGLFSTYGFECPFGILRPLFRETFKVFCSCKFYTETLWLEHKTFIEWKWLQIYSSAKPKCRPNNQGEYCLLQLTRVAFLCIQHFLVRMPLTTDTPLHHQPVVLYIYTSDVIGMMFSYEETIFWVQNLNLRFSCFYSKIC